MGGRRQVAGSTRQRLAVVTVVALALGMLGVSFQYPALALGDSKFDVLDGNTPDDDGAGTAEKDWDSTGVVEQELDDASQSAADDSISGSEDDTSVTMTDGSVQPNKSDLVKVRKYTEKVNGVDYLYLAWQRYPTANGVMAIDFELNQASQGTPPAPGNTWKLNRTDGDKLIVFEMVNGGTVPIISMLVWTTSGACEKPGQVAPCWGPAKVLTTATTPAAEGSVNTPGDIIFGELAIDLEAAGIFKAGQCTSFASLYVKSRSSGSSLANQISDIVKPDETSISNCGSLTVTKTVTGPTVAGDQTAFAFTVDCGSVDLNGAAAGDGAPFNLANGGSQVVPNLPVGTTCSVAETQPSPAAAWATSYKVNGGSSANGLTASNVSVPLAGSTVAFTNARQVGSLTISKTTTGGTGTFTFNVNCSVDSFDQQVQLTNNESKTITGIPTGTTCDVAEVTDGDFNSSPVGGYTGIVVDADGETASFTNTRKVGTLRIEKTTTGGTGTFLFTVDCEPGTTFDRTGANKVSITNSGSATITGIPTGTVCTVTEDADTDFTSTRSPLNGQVTIAEGTVAGNTVSFTNTRKVAGLTITKATSGGTGTFTFTVDCDGTAFDQTVTITGSGSETITGIPTGTDCNVTETPDALFTSTSNPADGDVTIDDDGETVAFTNVRKTGSLTITKAASGGNGNFTFTVDCTDDAFDQTVVVTTTGGSGSSAAITGIPTTTSCTVTETVPAGWAAVGGASKTVVVRGAETAAFGNRLLPSGIQVVKAASAATIESGADVTYTYVVTNVGENPLTSVKVVDDKCATVTFVGGDTDGDSTLDLTETWTYRCTMALTATTTNVATATGVDPRSQSVQDTDTKTVNVIHPAIAIDKAPSATSVDPGTSVTYTYTVTNPGDVALSNVKVADDKCSPVTFVGGDTNGDGQLQTTETWTFACRQVQTGDIDLLTNIGTATGVDPLGTVVTSNDTVTITVVAPLVIAAPPTLPRTGMPVRGWLQLGGSLLLLGVALVFTSRRIRQA